MLDLLSQYSLQNIVIFSISLAFAIKGCIDFYDWAKSRIRQPIDKENQKKKEEEDMLDKIRTHEEKINSIQLNQNEILRIVNILIDSDRDDIKSWITEKHHYFCYERKWIDDYNLDCIEKRYHYYKLEGGNSFVADLMEEIRALPKVDPMK